MSSSMINENDFDSPGYEYLRSIHSMSILYDKLVALGYHREMCTLYRCPTIHRYYFALQSKRSSEQRIMFNCLCAWLIKDKCQMNLELDPEEYANQDTTINVIADAMRLLLSEDENAQLVELRASSRNIFSFPVSRLKNSFGPEVVWTLNILADRALEFMFDSTTYDSKLKILYNNRTDSNTTKTSSCITIGQPFVGGGLTTRPIGSYQLDDAGLLFDDYENEARESGDQEKSNLMSSESSIDTEEWFRLIERARPTLEACMSNMTGPSGGMGEWRDFALAVRESKNSIQSFLDQSRASLLAIAHLIDNQLEQINSHEKSLRAALGSQMDEFLVVWRDYSSQLSCNRSLNDKVNDKTNQFVEYNDQLKDLNAKIDSRRHELNDGTRMRTQQQLITILTQENKELETQISISLAALGHKQTQLLHV